ncbi:hypothetical protein [Neisseria bergeri]|uniref:hypothetical protein n=1 Tax=Neisseria bergeri TaxID=1906581 RepID=UPI0027E15193|nr:hypothetical protein [Neisseria bergeri]
MALKANRYRVSCNPSPHAVGEGWGGGKISRYAVSFSFRQVIYVVTPDKCLNPNQFVG